MFNMNGIVTKLLRATSRDSTNLRSAAGTSFGSIKTISDPPDD